MSLREQAALDLITIVEDTATGFGWPITVRAPSGAEQTMTGLSTDIAQMIDTETGQIVSGRNASVAIALRTFETLFPALGYPRGIADSAAKPWLITFDSITGVSHTFKVADSNPDRALGVVTLLLERYAP